MQFNGIEWRIKLVSPNHPALASALGACDNYYKTIYINDSLDYYKTKKVLYHEIVHAVMFSYKIYINPYEEELLADLFASYGEGIVDFVGKIIRGKN